MISRVRGTEDHLDMTLRNYVLNTVKKHLEIHNFHEIQTPILEHTELFVHSLGSSTDVVSKEMYIFNENEEKSICLRPEHTASAIRACFENSIEHFPWKVFTHGPMFRRERPQKGRFRQFSQVSMEVIGAPSITHDIHFIKMLNSLFSDTLKLENYVLKINFLGCSQDRQNHKNKLISFLDSVSTAICATCLSRKDKNTLRIFDCKSETCQQLYKKAPKLTEFLCETCSAEWEQLQNLLHILSISYVIDHTLVRGLDYYNKTVFEFTSRELGAQSAFCGGGRYSLGREVGAQKDYECVGAAFGIERVLLLVERIQQKLLIPQQQTLHIIIPVSQAQDAIGLLLANQLQEKGLCTDIILEKASMSNMMKKVNRQGAQYALIIGEDEQKEGTVSIKNMLTGELTKVKQIEALQALK